MSQQMTAPPDLAARAAPRPVEALDQPRQPLRRSDLHYLHPAGRAPVVRHSRKLSEDPAGDRHQHRDSNWRWAASSFTSGCIRPARTSAASAWEFCCAHLRSGPTRCARPSPSCRNMCCASKGRHIWNPSNFGISAMLFLAPETVAELEHSVGQLSVAHAGDLGAGLGHHLAPAALSHHRHLCRLVPRFRVSAQLDHGQSVAVRDCADHRARCTSFSSSS